MQNPNIPRQKTEAELKIDSLLEKLKTVDIDLEQETADQEQLNPYERMLSIRNVWETIKDKLHNPETALDVGSGFGYGTVMLDAQGIKTVGIENVPAKNEQALELFNQLDITLKEIDKIDFENSPAILETDFNKLSDQEVTDLITMFYLSGELISNPETLKTCEKLLKTNGQMILSTEADRAHVEEILASGNLKLPTNFSWEIIDVPNNFEKTIILLTKN
ncbi:MAG: hypothetical protein A2406_00620 [Candidatus Komeilibacteria bacterium RIFOXYC1_FULL_37_11]|uniref:Methyltransferase domain-containing protein n=1 Tax=Candidatus Komeilibacteria bacterium RIFOXYC1_FULL_37_11 TaxID=1798555 RepID=A0A1G2BXY3_9BACT|nr:MAG: hypothetical protein A2406_00620 [Candidatus Komeilibacteria bacterium RIFOXYC1_FULL_37_11]OGY95991.1 MAG: hypothetical protein A2611_04235 [Candidatus Komeilibacteria bacterium RIFOXYD1_FULL_37_29]